MNEVSTTHLEIYYESEPYGKSLLRGGSRQWLCQDWRFEDLHSQGRRRLKTFSTPTITFKLEGSISPAGPKLHQLKKDKTEEWSTSYRSYQITIAKIEGLFYKFWNLEEWWQEKYLQWRPKTTYHQDQNENWFHKFPRRTMSKTKLIQTHSL